MFYPFDLCTILLGLNERLVSITLKEWPNIAFIASWPKSPIEAYRHHLYWERPKTLFIRCSISTYRSVHKFLDERSDMYIRSLNDYLNSAPSLFFSNVTMVLDALCPERTKSVRKNIHVKVSILKTFREFRPLKYKKPAGTWEKVASDLRLGYIFSPVLWFPLQLASHDLIAIR